jgi:hypothetical protein
VELQRKGNLTLWLSFDFPLTFPSQYVPSFIDFSSPCRDCTRLLGVAPCRHCNDLIMKLPNLFLGFTLENSWWYSNEIVFRLISFAPEWLTQRRTSSEYSPLLSEPKSNSRSVEKNWLLETRFTTYCFLLFQNWFCIKSVHTPWFSTDKKEQTVLTSLCLEYTWRVLSSLPCRPESGGRTVRQIIADNTIFGALGWFEFMVTTPSFTIFFKKYSTWWQKSREKMFSGTISERAMSHKS